jgi:hypothetical protein
MIALESSTHAPEGTCHGVLTGGDPMKRADLFGGASRRARPPRGHDDRGAAVSSYRTAAAAQETNGL